jgi:hypothetical protein
MWRKLGIEPGEGQIFAWGALTLFLLGWTDVSVKNVAETLFLKRVGVERLPLVFLANDVLLVGSTWAFGRLAVKSDRLTLLPRTLLGLSLLLGPLWLLVRADLHSAFVLLVIASKQLISIALLVFWIAMGDLLHGRQAKRLFAPMMAGVTLGTIAGSFASRPLGLSLGISDLLPVSAATLALAGLACLPLRALRPHLDRRGVAVLPAHRRVDHGGAPAPAVGSVLRFWRESELFRLLLVVALCSGLVGPMLYFQFSYVADLATAGADGERRLLSFYAWFRGWLSLGILGIQLGVAGALFRRIGIPLSAALSPVFYLLGFLGLTVQLSLPAGVGAMAGTKLQDNAIYDPALRVLYGLFPEHLRSRASALVEGPLKRAGGALGNVTILAALSAGSAVAVGYTALPIALVWLAAALVLWRRYPRMLLRASASGARRGDRLEGAALLDPSTVRALQTELCSPDPARCRVAVDLVCEAEPERAVAALTEAAAKAPTATRPLLIGALDRLLERAVDRPLRNPDAAGHLEALLAEPERLTDRDRADVVQAYGRLVRGDAASELLERELEDPSAAVRLAARAALARRGAGPDASVLDAELEAALCGDDPAARRTAREEFRAFLLAATPDASWERRLDQLASLVEHPEDRADAVEALAEVAARHGTRAASVRDSMLAARDDPHPRVRAGLLRYVGHARLIDQTAWIVEHVGSERETSANAAREALRALGPLGSDVLLRELSFGKRSKREGILEVMQDLDVSAETLRVLFETELDAVERDLAYLRALGERPAYVLLYQRLRERVQEQLHTAVMFLAAIRREAGIAELGDRLQHVHGLRRQYAIALEGLESLLTAEERARIIPLLEQADLEEAARAAERGRAPLPLERALEALRRDPDELTRRIANGVAVAAGAELVEDEGVDDVEKAMHLRALPIFEGLTARQLMDLAGVVKEQTLPAESVVVTQGEFDDRFYLVVDGVVHILREERLLAEMGPGDFFGEIALFEGIPRTATAVTRTRVRLLRLERTDLMRLIEEMPAIAITLLQTLSRRLRELTDRLTV